MGFSDEDQIFDGNFVHFKGYGAKNQ